MFNSEVVWTKVSCFLLVIPSLYALSLGHYYTGGYLAVYFILGVGSHVMEYPLLVWLDRVLVQYTYTPWMIWNLRNHHIQLTIGFIGLSIVGIIYFYLRKIYHTSYHKLHAITHVIFLAGNCILVNCL